MIATDTSNKVIGAIKPAHCTYDPDTGCGGDCKCFEQSSQESAMNEDRVVKINVLTHMQKLVACITRCEQNAFTGMWTDVTLERSGESILIVGPINKVEWILRELNPQTDWREILNTLGDL